MDIDSDNDTIYVAARDSLYIFDGLSWSSYYFNADLFLMPSLNINYNFEGFGLVFLEAAAYGVSSIGSIDSGCGEAIQNGQTGYLVNPFDFGDIARKMDLILNQDSIDKENCLNWAKQNDIKIKAKELLDFYGR